MTTHNLNPEIKCKKCECCISSYRREIGLCTSCELETRVPRTRGCTRAPQIGYQVLTGLRSYVRGQKR